MPPPPVRFTVAWTRRMEWEIEWWGEVFQLENDVGCFSFSKTRERERGRERERERRIREI
jgi:hypothetical protein